MEFNCFHTENPCGFLGHYMHYFCVKDKFNFYWKKNWQRTDNENWPITIHTSTEVKNGRVPSEDEIN
jgi:hypothetical protein